jgi:hypothetical protein
MHPTGEGHLAWNDRGILAMVNPSRLRRIPDEDARRERVLSPHRHPRALEVPPDSTRTSSTRAARNTCVDYLPAESNSGMFGGNSNWRGPIWMPVNIMIIRALLNFYLYYGDNFKIECPTGSGKR